VPVIFNPSCSNGILDSGEQCDDGNQFANDGCNPSCQIENATAFLCVNVTAQGPTQCCPALVNPVTLQKVCDCAGQETDNAGYIISRDCRKINVNECAMGTSACHRNAMCFDKDAALNASVRYECICPLGMIGDGIESCSVFSYETRFSVVKKGVTLDSFDRASFKMVLGSRKVIPSWISENRVTIMYSEYKASGGGQRRLLQSSSQSPDTQIDVSVFSETVGEMNNITESTNASLLTESGYEVVSHASSFTNDYNNADEAAGAVSAGFQVDSVQFDDKTARWNVNVRYTSGVPNTIASLYLSKAGTSPSYSQAVKNTYLVSTHPCLTSNSVCCLNSYKNLYNLGAFASNITQNIGTCNAATQVADTISLFNLSGVQNLVDHALDAYADSSVHRISANQVQLRIAQTDLFPGGIAMKQASESNPSGYKLVFFVGVTYITLLPTNALSVVASQTTVTLEIGNSIVFSFASSQDYSFVRYMTLSIMQNKWVDGIIERKMQFVKMEVVLPNNSEQNPSTGLVPLTSVRFAIAQSSPDKMNASLWTNPCFSTDQTGMYDSSTVRTKRVSYYASRAFYARRIYFPQSMTIA